MDAPRQGNGRKWIEMMRKKDPQHAKNYCDHGQYIGSNGLFRERCEECNST